MAEDYDVGLPKWPQMIVYGDRISEENALEVIRRCDAFISNPMHHGNDHEWEKAARTLMGYPEERFSGTPEERQAYFQQIDDHGRRWRCLDLHYLPTTWISSAYIGGPDGWCHPNGIIRSTKNIGKWPSVEEVAKEWRLIAEAFPFINLAAVLMDREESEENPLPLVVFRVKDGQVTVTKPTSTDPFREFGTSMAAIGLATGGFTATLARFMDSMASGGHRHEHAISLDQISKWARQVEAENATQTS